LNALELDRVSLSRGEKTILSDVTLAVGEGEFVGVLGANGAGKTTLMKAVLGLLPLDKGDIRVFGKPVSRGNAAIGYMPQTRSLPPELRLSGRDFLATAIRGDRWGVPLPGKDDRREIDRCLDAVGAQHLASHSLGDMSGGERQRLMIAQALIGSPRLLLLDEPLISLDPHQQGIVVHLVRDLSRSLGLTVLFSAHELNQLLGAVDRVLYLGHGHAALGKVDEVINPDTLSRLYDAPIEVVRAGGHIFVMSGGQIVERDRHEGHTH